MKTEITLHPNFSNTLQELVQKYGEDFLHLNGFSDTQLNYSDFISNFTSNNVADISIDANANVNSRDVVTLLNEMNKSAQKLLAFNKLFLEIEEQYSLRAAKRWLEDEFSGALYLHDAHLSTYVPYCYSYDLEDLVNKGLFFIPNFQGGAPRHLSTFTSFVCEYISFCAQRSAGSVGLPNFLIYSFYFWKKDIEEKYPYASDPEYYRRQNLQEFLYRINQPYLRNSIQSAFTNTSIFDRAYLNELFKNKKYPCGSLITDNIEGIIEYQKVFLEVMSETRQNNLMSFPVNTISLLYQDGSFIDEDFARWACAHNMKWNDSNFYISEDVASLSNCCRLVVDISNIPYFNSIGGTALAVGSVRINTINLARIAYEAQDECDFLDILRRRTWDSCIVLDVSRSIIKRNIEKGLLPNFDHGLISLDNLYNTIGFTGLYEALKYFNYVLVDKFGNHKYSDGGLEFAEEIFYTLNTEMKDFSEEAEADYIINLEQSPAEKCAAILMQKDKKLYPDGIYDLPLYGNQFIPLGVKTTLAEKVSLSAILDKACSAGSILHANLDAPLTSFDAAWKLLNYMAHEGVPYFAFNVKISACENNHGFYGEICPVCGGEVKTTYQRIVGLGRPNNIVIY